MFQQQPANAEANGAASVLTVGVGQVKIPAYLLDSSLAVRIGTSEFDYVRGALWAERLDTGIQRVLAANLGFLLPPDQIVCPRGRARTLGRRSMSASNNSM